MPKKTAPTRYNLAAFGNEGSTSSTRSKRVQNKRGSSWKKNKQTYDANSQDNDSVDPTDGAASLTYSATSSVHSGGSATGESTDSSFADIMRVLDMQDGSELAALCKKEGVSSPGELREKANVLLRSKAKSDRSMGANSLAYSTDGESTLNGATFLQTIAGQPSDSYGFDGGSSADPHQEQPIEGDMDILFAPAAPVDNYKQRKKEKQARREAEKANSTPKAKGSGRNTLFSDTTDNPPTPDASTSSRSPSSRRMASPTGPDLHPYQSSPSGRSLASKKTSSPPPLPPKGETYVEGDEDIWYGQWWIACFPDSFKNLMPKR